MCIRDRFIAAANENDVDTLTLVFKMFPMVGQDSLGLDLYSKYVCDIIAEESRKILTQKISQSTNTSYYSQALLHLFKIVSTIINDHSKIIATCYGKKFMIHVMENVEKEADLQAGLLLDIFAESRNLDGIVKDIDDWNLRQRKHAQRQKQRTINNSMSDHNEVDNDDGGDDSSMMNFSMNQLVVLVNEFSQILQNWSMYARFFSVRWNEFSDLEPANILIAPTPISNSKFIKKLNEEQFLSNFEKLTMYYLQKSFSNSISIEELPKLNDLIELPTFVHKEESLYPITSVLEDLSLLIRKNLISNVNTGQFELFQSFIDQLSTFIQNEYLVKFMQVRLKMLQPKLSGSIGLKKYVPKIDSTSPLPSRTVSPMNTNASSSINAHGVPNLKLSSLSKFDFRGAAASALTNIQSNLQTGFIEEAITTNVESAIFLHHYLIYINSLYVSKLLFHKLLIEELIEENPKLLSDNFPFKENSKTLITKLQSCESLIDKQTDKLIKWSIKYMFQNIFLSKIRVLLNQLFINGDNNENFYIAGMDNYEDLTKINEFVRKWQHLIIPYQNVLFDKGINELLTLVVEFIVNLLEKRFDSLQVNELGATKLDRELSLFIGTVCGLNYKLRERFTRLTQIVLLLGFDDDDFDVETQDVKEDISTCLLYTSRCV